MSEAYETVKRFFGETKAVHRVSTAFVLCSTLTDVEWKKYTVRTNGRILFCR